MTEEKEVPTVDEIKDRLKVEIPVEEEQPAAEAGTEKTDFGDELRKVGEQFAETLRSAWDSDERQKIGGEIREGMQNFAAEIDKVIDDIREGTAGQKLREEAEGLKTQVKSGDLGQKARSGFAEGLAWLGEEFGKLAQQFTPREKGPTDVEPVVEVNVEDTET